MSLQAASLKVTIGDIVASDSAAGEVKACIADDEGDLFVITQIFQRVGMLTPHSDIWNVTEHLGVWQATSLVLPRAWYPDGDHFVLIW